MRSHVCFGSTFASNPRFRITWSISYSPLCAVNLISIPVRDVCFSSFWTMCDSPNPAHLVMCSCSLFTALQCHNSFMHVSRKVVSIDGSIFGYGLSFLPKMEAYVKLFLASINVSFARSKSNLGSFVGALWTHAFSLCCLSLSSLVMIFLRSMMFTLGSSSFACFESREVGVSLYRVASLLV